MDIITGPCTVVLIPFGALQMYGLRNDRLPALHVPSEVLIAP